MLGRKEENADQLGTFKSQQLRIPKASGQWLIRWILEKLGCCESSKSLIGRTGRYGPVDEEEECG
jgi:hypothetical protein